MDWSRKTQPDGNGGSIYIRSLDMPGLSLDDALLKRAFLSMWAVFVNQVVPSHGDIEWDCCRATFYWYGGRMIVEPRRKEPLRGFPVAACSVSIEPLSEWAQSLIFSNRADGVVEREVDTMLHRCCRVLAETGRRQSIGDILGSQRSLVECWTPEERAPFESFTLLRHESSP